MAKAIKRTKFDVFIQLPSGEITVISREDENLLKVFPVWGITGSKSKYVFVERSVKTEYSTIRERIYLHRVIVRPVGKEQVDHIDRDRLNNRRSNLRICYPRQNVANTGPKNGKKYKGVHWEGKYRNLTKPYGCYISFIDAKTRGQQKREYLGRFKTAEEAAKAYDKRAKEIYGEFAYLNFPDL